jgi:uncharacterized protein (TIGR03118 family)
MPHNLLRNLEDKVKNKLSLLGLLIALAIPSAMRAQQTGYSQTNLVSNTAGVATTTDPQLLNPWGISILPGQDFWIADNNSGVSTLYDAQGTKNALVVTIPGATHNPNGNCSPGCPTGTVSNGNGSYFGGGSFIFDTEDGIIANWTGASTAVVAFDNSASGAVYKGLALLNSTFLLAANFNSGKVDIYDRNFTPTSLSGSFTDPNLPVGFAPHGIHVIGNQIYVAYAMQDTAKHDAQPGAGLGQIDVFDANGNFMSTFVAVGAQLNAPWGILAAPATFGTFSNAILVGNFGDGIINAFDTTGHFLGQLTDSSNHALVNPGLWEMALGAGGPSGDPNTLYLTAGGSNQPNFPAGGSTTSLFASVVPASSAGAPNFALNLSTQSATVPAGGSASLTINSSAVGAFNAQISLSCSTAAGLTCAFSPATISPGSSASSSTLTISAAATPPPGPGGYLAPHAAALFPGLAVFGTLLITRKRKPLNRKSILWTSALGVLLLLSLFALGCGSSSSRGQKGGSQVTMMVTGTSGALSHSSAVTITVM